MRTVAVSILCVFGWVVLWLVGVMIYAAQGTEHHHCEVDGVAGVLNVDGTCVTPAAYVAQTNADALEAAAAELEAFGVPYYDTLAANLRLSAALAHPNPLRRPVPGQGTISEYLFGIAADDPILEIWDRPPTLQELVARYFPWPVIELAVDVAWCESRHDPQARHPTSGASGYFQHLPRYWADRSAAAGWGGADIFDPEANVAVAAWLWGQTGSFWTHWYPSGHCWS